MPNATTATFHQVLDALNLAERVLDSPACFAPSRDVAMDLARALLQMRDTLARAQATSDAIRPGDLMRMSTKLLQDLHLMPGHESCTVKYVRAERGADGVMVLMLQHADQEVCQ